MSFLKNLLSKTPPIQSNKAFWDWFQKNERTFFNAVSRDKDVENLFFSKLSPKLSELKDGYFFLTGMLDDKTAELIITADGHLKNIVFVEELVASAPQIAGWKFTALKPGVLDGTSEIKMDNLTFGSKNMKFYYNVDENYPDEIDITIIHDDWTVSNKETVTTGTHLFLDNYLGELNFATTIDNLNVQSVSDVTLELIPIEKLKDFLIWRQKEFIEKYEGKWHNSENDNYVGLEAQLQNGNPLIAVVNADLLEWDSKASHPWILRLEIRFDGLHTNGMPDSETYELLNQVEDAMLYELKDHEGYLNIGRETAESVREIYFACKDFRKPSKVAHSIIKQYTTKNIKINYNIFKDKYWKSFDRYRNQGKNEDD